MEPFNDINARVALPDNQRLLIAQQSMYSNAKVWRGSRVCGETILVFSAFVVGLLPRDGDLVTQETGLVVIALATVVLAVVSLVLEYQEDDNRTLAANIQEKFDVAVLGLAKSTALSQRVAPEAVEDAARGKIWDADNTWYPDVRSFPPAVGALICQRSNLVWDERARRSYATFLLLLLIVFVVIAAIVVVAFNPDVRFFLVAVCLPIAPALQQLVRSVLAHRRAANEKEALAHEADDLWEQSKVNGGIEFAMLRPLQDRLLVLRRSQPPVPDFFQRLFRQTNESSQEAAAHDLLTEWDRAMSARETGS